MRLEYLLLIILLGHVSALGRLHHRLLPLHILSVHPRLRVGVAFTLLILFFANDLDQFPRDIGVTRLA
jgi:hypothetical protein